MPGYDKSLEEVLETKAVPHYKNKDWGATIISVISYNGGKPKIQLSHRYKKEGEEANIIPFVSMPTLPRTIEKINSVLMELAKKYGPREDEDN